MRNRNRTAEETASETPTTTIQNPRKIDAPQDLEAKDFGIVPGGKKLPGNTDDPGKQSDHEARERYEEVRKANLSRPNESELDALRRRVSELESTVHGRRRD